MELDYNCFQNQQNHPYHASYLQYLISPAVLAEQNKNENVSMTNIEERTISLEKKVDKILNKLFDGEK